jgi:ribose transport system permease protein
MNRIRAVWNAALKHTMFIPALLVISLIIINWALQPNLFKPAVFRMNILTFSPLILVAAGQAIIMICGNLDLSVGYGVSLINVILAKGMTTELGRNAMVMMVALAVAITMGIINGVLVGYLRVPSLIGTFASSFVWYGVAIMVCPIPGGRIPRPFTQFFKAHIGPFNVIFLVIVIAIVGWHLIRKYRIGRYIYATGSNKEAAYINGINVKGITLVAFAIGWIFVYLGTIALSAQTRSGDARVGEPFMLNSIAAAVIGGVSLAGGRGSPFGAALSAVSLSIILNIIYFAGIPTSYQVLVRGIIIILAIGSAVFYKRKYD